MVRLAVEPALQAASSQPVQHLVEEAIRGVTFLVHPRESLSVACAAEVFTGQSGVNVTQVARGGAWESNTDGPMPPPGWAADATATQGGVGARLFRSGLAGVKMLPGGILFPQSLARVEDPEWAVAEMSGARVRDPRRIKSLGKIVGRLAEHAGLSFSTAAGQDGRQAAHRICSDPQVGLDALLAGHVAQTARRCRQEERVLVAQDTTTCSYNTHLATTGLGPLNEVGSGLGFFLHPALAMTEEGLPLGVLYAKAWARDPQEVGQSKERRNRDSEEKESYKWVEGLHAVSEHLAEGPQVVLIQDREGDAWPLLSAERPANVDLLVRASQPRNVEVQVFGGRWERSAGNLLQVAAEAPVVGTTRIWVPRKEGRPGREAEVQLRACEVRVLPPRHRRASACRVPQRLWVVAAIETNPPPGEMAVQWTLITTLRVRTKEDACRILRYYTKRWIIERFNYTLKSGCRVEKLQVDEAHALINTVALHIPVAWRLMWLTYMARTSPDAPATQLLSRDELEILSHAEGRRMETARDVVIALAKLGGHQHHRKAGHPGMKSMWQGLRRLTAMAQGWHLALGIFSQTNV